MGRIAKNLPADVERYVQEGLDQGMSEDKAWAVAWSRYCKYKNPGSDHCTGSPGDYFRGKKSAGRVEYPDYDPQVTIKTRKISAQARKLLDVINRTVYLMESRGGSPAQNNKIQKKLVDLHTLGKMMTSLARDVIGRFSGKFVSPQTQLRLRTLEDLTEHLEGADSTPPTLSTKLARKAEDLYGDISGVGAVLDNLWDRSTKATPTKVARRFLLATQRGIMSKINRLLASWGMDGKSTYSDLYKPWAAVQTILSRSRLSVNMQEVANAITREDSTTTLPISGSGGLFVIFTWEKVQGGFKVTARVEKPD